MSASSNVDLTISAGEHPAARQSLAADLLAGARPLVGGVVLTMHEGDVAALEPLLAVLA